MVVNFNFPIFLLSFLSNLLWIIAVHETLGSLHNELLRSSARQGIKNRRRNVAGCHIVWVDTWHRHLRQFALASTSLVRFFCYLYITNWLSTFWHSQNWKRCDFVPATPSIIILTGQKNALNKHLMFHVTVWGFATKSPGISENKIETASGLKGLKLYH